MAWTVKRRQALRLTNLSPLSNKGIERDAPDVAPLDKGGLASQIRNENFDEGSTLDPLSPLLMGRDISRTFSRP
jgi:hypothetical protein